ncbi:MAG: hypothetical protein ABI560_13570 [Myxococcales bacterium]
MPATGSGGHGYVAGAGGTTGTGGAVGSSGGASGAVTSSGGASGVTASSGGASGVTASSGGASGTTDAGGASGGSEGGTGGQAGVGGGAGSVANAVDGGPGVGADAGGAVKVYDLKNDWSDTQNPNGPWTVMIGTAIAKNRPNWLGETGQNAYVTAATGAGHIPVLVKVSASNFEGNLAQKGDLVVVAQDEAGGAGLGQARILWTAPSSGIIDVDASFWLARTSLKRKDVYTVTIAGAMKGMGEVPSTITRDTPVKFSQKGLPITKGETVEVQIIRAMTCDACTSSPCDGKKGGTCAEFCDYLLKITHTSQ